MQKLSTRQGKVDVVKVFADKPLTLSELTRIASNKIRDQYGIAKYINILDAHWFMQYKLYVVLFEIPKVFLTATSESSKD